MIINETPIKTRIHVQKNFQIMEINGAEVLKFLTEGNQRDLPGKEQLF